MHKLHHVHLAGNVIHFFLTHSLIWLRVAATVSGWYLVVNRWSLSCSQWESVSMPKALFQIPPCSCTCNYSAISSATAVSLENRQPQGAEGDVPPTWRTEHSPLAKAAGGTPQNTGRLCSDPLKHAWLPFSFSRMSSNTPSLDLGFTDLIPRHLNFISCLQETSSHGSAAKAYQMKQGETHLCMNPRVQSLHAGLYWKLFLFFCKVYDSALLSLCTTKSDWPPAFCSWASLISSCWLLTPTLPLKRFYIVNCPSHL